jgi:hypothetical protein
VCVCVCVEYAKVFLAAIGIKRGCEKDSSRTSKLS